MLNESIHETMGLRELVANRPCVDGGDAILTPEAAGFVDELAAHFAPQAKSLLAARKAVQERLDGGILPSFDPETEEIRKSDWKVAPAPAVLEDRRVEITAPAEAKKAILALNSPAKAYMADFEDSLTPSWGNLISGQAAMYGASRGKLAMTDPARNKNYRLEPDHSCQLIVRPRGWHLPERNFVHDGEPVPGALVDFGLFMFHNAFVLAEEGTGPFFYLPKLEHWKEAQLWEDIMSFAEERLGLERNVTKATVLIETLPAVFQMHEILHALKSRILGLNCGRWDYIFSYIKSLRGHADRILPDRGAVAMAVPFLKAYSLELVRTCHQRGCHAMGGMAALIPISGDPEANERALQGVREDKRREAANGHDGTWVAHPGLIGMAQKVFDESMPGPNQKDKIPGTAHTAEQLLAVPEGPKSKRQFDNNIIVSLHYISAWLEGCGAVPIFNLMEDAATAEISRSQLWQWIRYGTQIDGKAATAAMFESRLQDALGKAGGTFGATLGSGTLDKATGILKELVLAEECPDFLTLKTYEFID